MAREQEVQALLAAMSNENEAAQDQEVQSFSCAPLGKVVPLLVSGLLKCRVGEVL